jgi:secondary thiamine-phosphate synthase enzyme
MTIVTESIQTRSRGENDMIDITRSISKTVEDSKIKHGIVTVFVAGSTAAVTTIEYEPGLKIDFPKMLSRIAPKNVEYEHDKTWHDGNGHSPSQDRTTNNGRIIIVRFLATSHVQGKF